MKKCDPARFTELGIIQDKEEEIERSYRFCVETNHTNAKVKGMYTDFSKRVGFQIMIVKCKGP